MGCVVDGKGEESGPKLSIIVINDKLLMIVNDVPKFPTKGWIVVQGFVTVTSIGLIGRCGVKVRYRVC